MRCTEVELSKIQNTDNKMVNYSSKKIKITINRSMSFR